MKTKLINARDIHARAMVTDPAYRAEYEAMEEEFELVNSMIQARIRAQRIRAAHAPKRSRLAKRTSHGRG
jgi:hypothetical protein